MKKKISFLLIFVLLFPINIFAANQVPNTNRFSDKSMQMVGDNYYKNVGLGTLQEPITYQNEMSLGIQAPPAWAQKSLAPISSSILYPFASNLFLGNFASTYQVMYNSEYLIQVGDRIEIKMWGGTEYSSVLTVDTQGNIFLPNIGPIHVEDVKQANLLSIIKAKLSKVYTNNVEVYINLLTALPLSVYVTGFVVSPGRYAGNSRDPIVAFIDRAGGIQFDRGSYREIEVIRNKKVITCIDLYDFVLYGKMNNILLKDGDIILIKEKKISVAAIGLIKDQAVYELKNSYTGNELIKYCIPLPGVSHVSISGIRNGEPVRKYMTLDSFKGTKLSDGDIIEFIMGNENKEIMISVIGAIEGNNRFPISKGVTLKNLLPYIKVNSSLASTESIYILRQSVAVQQKKILEDSLNRLEQSALTATSSTTTEASIRVQEAQLIQDFVKRASLLEPDGVVVVSHHGKISDLILEDHDVIVIPQKSDVVHVSGEVMIPKTIVWDQNMDLANYIKLAGGFSNRADKHNVLVVKMNGEVGKVSEIGIHKGDRILVLPRFDTKNIDLIASITQILYQIAIATSVVVDLTDNK